MAFYLWALLILSVFLYVLPFWLSTYCWWVSFLFPIPFFFVVVHEDVSFKKGFVWGFIMFCLHAYGFLWSVVVSLASGPYLYRFLLMFCAAVYMGLLGGVWFWIMGVMQKKLCLTTNLLLHVLVWVCSLWLYMFFIERYSLYLFDICEGYFLVNPVLTFATEPRLLQLLPYVGKNILSLCIYIFAGIFVIIIIKKDWKLWPFLFIALCPWLISLYLSFYRKKNVPAWISHIACLRKTYASYNDDSTIAHMMHYDIQHLLGRYPDTALILLPESSVYAHSFFNNSDAVQMLNCSHIGDSVDIIAGSFYKDQTFYRNTCYWVSDGVVQKKFNKRHAMLITERIPSLCNSMFLKDMFFSQMPEIGVSNNMRPCLEIKSVTKVCPYICSEFFFNEWPDDIYSCPILLIVNDKWCKVSYISDLMYVTARFKAIQWQRDIMYVSFTRSVFLDKWGYEYPIAT